MFTDDARDVQLCGDCTNGECGGHAQPCPACGCDREDEDALDLRAAHDRWWEMQKREMDATL